MHTFTDFIDISRALMAQGYGNESSLCHGWQRQRLVDGRVVNLAPELIKGVVAQVPFVDVLTPCLMSQFL
ncbi:MAG: hypothetical protein ACR5LF_13250 [Symbiopectobacterium sp.]